MKSLISKIWVILLFVGIAFNFSSCSSNDDDDYEGVVTCIVNNPTSEQTIYCFEQEDFDFFGAKKLFATEVKAIDSQNTATFNLEPGTYTFIYFIDSNSTKYIKESASVSSGGKATVTFSVPD